MGKQDGPRPCGTCNGSGTIAHVFIDKNGNRLTTQRTCHGCGGSGTR